MANSNLSLRRVSLQSQPTSLHRKAILCASGGLSAYQDTKAKAMLKTQHHRTHRGESCEKQRRACNIKKLLLFKT